MKPTETSSPAPANCEVIHSFTQGNPVAERRTRWVMWLTLVMMVLEIAGGWIFNSMALMADGWHMSSHAFALGLTVFAYRMAARYARDRRFAFGTWKMEILGGYTSALLLVGVAISMLVESVERMVNPLPIGYDQAIATAVLVGVWAKGLLRDCALVLLDAEMDNPLTERIARTLTGAAMPVKVQDLHLWRVANDKYACIVALQVASPAVTPPPVADVAAKDRCPQDAARSTTEGSHHHGTDAGWQPRPAPDYFRQLLSAHPELVHITVEVDVVATGGLPAVTH